MSLDEFNDPLIDSALDEILGEVTPPDLSARILERLQHLERNETRVARKKRPAKTEQYKAKRLSPWSSVVVAAICLSLLVTATGIIAWNEKQNRQRMAEEVDPVVPSNTTPARSEPPSNQMDKIVQSEADSMSEEVNPQSSGPIDQSPLLEPELVKRTPDLFGTPKHFGAAVTSDEQIVDLIDNTISARWESAGIAKVIDADDDEWCRLVFEKLIGRMPSTSELRSFSGSSRPSKKSDLIIELLESPRYAAEFNNHWVNLWAEKYDVEFELIDEAVSANRPHDEIVRQVVSETETDIVEICRTVLGRRYQCATCHTDTYYGNSQQRLAELNSALEARDELALQLARADQMRRRLVNDLWSHFFEFGLVTELGGFETTSEYDDLLERLAVEFASHQHDTKRLIKWIVSSRPFGLSNKASPDHIRTDQPDLQTAALFSRRYRRPFLADSVHVALGHVAAASFNIVGGNSSEKGAIGSRAPVLDPKNKQDPSTSDEILRTLEIMGSDPQISAIPIGNDSLVEKLAASKLNNKQRIDHVFLLAAHREASDEEMKTAQQILDANENNQSRGLRDIWWAILSSRSVNR